MARTARAVVLQKQARALALVRAGRSYDEIAADLGYANRGSAYRLTQNALQAAVDRLAEDHLGYELDRLDALTRQYWQAATTDHDLKAAYMILKVIDARMRLLGLDRRSKARASADAEPRSILLSPAERAAWEADGSPEVWRR